MNKKLIRFCDICCFRSLVGICSLCVYILINNAHLLAADSLFSQDSDVVQLSSSNFNSVIYGSSRLWMINFYMPWCGHCQRFAPVYSNFATSIKGIIDSTYSIIITKYLGNVMMGNVTFL